jgi:arabinan endo-1,5-alpha-L-arabinosidase
MSVLVHSQPLPTKQLLQSSAAVFPLDDVHPPEMDVHDPSVALVGKTYCLFATSRGDFCPIWTSPDRVHWKFGGPILSQAPEWLREAVPNSGSVWAPAPLVVGDKLRVYYCASQKFGSNTSFIGMAECDSFDPEHPAAGWVDHGKLIESDAGKDNFNAIDPDVCIGPDGRHWMVYGSYWSGIYEVELDPVSGLLKSGAALVHVASNTQEKGNPLEAPFLRYHNGLYYLFVTYGLAAQGVRSTYRTVVGRSSNPEGPFVGFDGTPMTEGGHADLLKSSPPMFGPGGGNMFEDENGDWWLAYHYYDSTRHWVRDMWGKPTLQIRRVVWGEDGWPLAGLPDSVRIELGRHHSFDGTWLLQEDFGDPVELTIARDGSFRSGNRAGTWTRSGDGMLMKWATDTFQVEVDGSQQFWVGRNSRGAVVRGIKIGANIQRL